MQLQTILEYELVRVRFRPVLDLVAGTTAGFIAEIGPAEATPHGTAPLTPELFDHFASDPQGGADLERLVVHRAGAAFATSSARTSESWLIVPTRGIRAEGRDPARHVADLAHVLAGAGLPRSRFALELQARDAEGRAGAAVRVHGFELGVRGSGSGRRTLARWARMMRSELTLPIGRWAAGVRTHGTQPILDGVRGASDLLEAQTSGIQLVAGPIVGEAEDRPTPVTPELARVLRRRRFSLPPLPTPRLRVAL
ncbi:MAG: hypothetical protein JJ863_16635 [Deltaproteobacteria bacterium]|nr:hypothetical protein [Deltaproteobacteria bacterium]